MRGMLFSLTLAAFVVTLLLLPAPLSPMRAAEAWHVGAVECTPGGSPVRDGAIAPSEYGENFFDGKTKLLVYFDWDDSTPRLLHVGIVSPSSGWVGFLVQASESWNGFVNEIRIAYAPSLGGLQVMDAYGNFSEGTTSPDTALGGSSDVLDAATGTTGAARVYEFSLSLQSSDRYDNQLDSFGPFYFALESGASELDLSAAPMVTSDLHQLVLVQTTESPSEWTSVELALTPSATPLAPSTMLITLRDATGYPVPSAQLEVFVSTAFGFFDAGPVLTNEQGVAEFSYEPRDSGDYLLGAAYTGGYGLLASVSWQLLTVGSSASDGTVGFGPIDAGGLELRPVEALIVVVVLGVWATYAYAFFVTRFSMREGRASSSAKDVRQFKWKPGK